MRISHIFSILKKDLVLGPKNPFFLIAILAPLAFTFLINLVFGGLFAQQPVVGVYDLGSSEITAKFESSDSLIFQRINSEQEILDKVEAHNLDAGLVLSSDFDQQLISGQTPKLTVYLSGQSLAKNRLVVIASLTQYLREIAGQSAPDSLEQITLGEGEAYPISDRLFPMVMIMTVMMAGTFLTALSLLNEKEKNTLTAITVTPANLTEVLIAKAVLGFIIGLITGLAAIFFNNAVGPNFWLILVFLAGGLIMAVEIGLLLGIKSKDNISLMTAIKSIGIIVYAPVLVYLFPNIPEWIGKIFPTYYFIDPIFSLAIAQGSWPGNQLSFFILIGILILLVFPVLALAKKLAKQG
ncbi:MAG: ABC transporter permease [Patescibacteria group bacterium]